MKNYKALVLAAIVLAGSVFASCSKEGYWKKADAGVSYSLPAATLNYTFAPADEMTKVQVPVVRTDTKESASLPITATVAEASAKYFSFPSSVEFAAGQKEAFFEIGIVEKFNMGQSIPVTLKFDKSLVSPAGVDSTKVNIKLDYNWEYLGKGKYNDVIIWKVEDFVEADFYQAVENPSIFKIADPYTQMNKDQGVSTKAGNDADAFLQFRILEVGESLYDVTITKPDLVYFNPYFTGHFDPSMERHFIYHPSHFGPFTEDDFVCSRVESYQEDGLPAQVYLSPVYYYPDTGYWDAGAYLHYIGVITIYFPDVPVYDYSVSLNYAGREINAYDEEFVKTEVSLGSDVDSVQFAMSCLLSKEELHKAMLAGEVASTTFAASDITDGTVLVPMDADGSGKYILMAITYGGEDEESYDSQDYDYVEFVYSSGAEEAWIPVAGGDYTFSGGEAGTYTFASFVGLEEVTPMNLYQSSTDGSKWKLYPYIGGELIFYTDIYNEVFVAEGFTGLETPAEGYKYVVIDAYYNGPFTSEPGWFDPDTDIFHLMPGYVIMETMTIYAYGEDTFEITGAPYEIDETAQAVKAKKYSEMCKEIKWGEPKSLRIKHERKPIFAGIKVNMTKIDVVD